MLLISLSDLGQPWDSCLGKALLSLFDEQTAFFEPAVALGAEILH